MRCGVFKVAVACTTLAIGVLTASVRQHFFRHQSASPTTAAAPAPVPAHTETPYEAEIAYPENIGLHPYDIEYFIDQNPLANLDPLWKRLKIIRDEALVGFNGCFNCKAESFAYNLDDDLDEEVVLRIGDDTRQSSRYLVFKVRSYNDSKLLGYIDAYSKYRPSRHFVVLSGGKQWLVVDSQGASGSGLAAYLQTVYEVSSKGVKPMVSFLSEVHQSGFAALPYRKFFGRIISCESKRGVATVTIDYDLEYFNYDDKKAPLFTKEQRAVLIGPVSRGETRLDVSRSTITQHEFDTVFNFDSMGDEEFLHYNLDDLRSIATSNNPSAKEWLKEYLANCPKSNIKRELQALANKPQQ